MNYTGYRFRTNNGMDCLVVEDKFNNTYKVINMDTFCIIAGDKPDKIDELIKTIIVKF